MQALGIDIGGTGIKGAVVDTRDGKLVTERTRVETPHPATPDAVAEVVGQISRQLSWTGPIGVTFPGVVKRGVIHTAANVDDSWVGLHASGVFAKATGCHCFVVNDADAAGEAEARFGHPEARHGVVLLLTLGTGIGSALVADGLLIPNTELGHLKMGKKQVDAEKRAAELVREREHLSWKKWAGRLSEYLEYLEALLWPDLFVLGGGVSASADKFVPRLRCRTPVVAAQLENEAGIVGAALAVHHPGGAGPNHG
ncbi:MAG TPA: ROK family protein [Acidimicrobiales bacterium]|nr:ROK family protein [Acidimicrobiales bacterium]